MTSTTPKRVLAVIRLSRETDETTSPARQRAVISSWTQANGHVLAGIAEDLDVSGAVSPFDRPGLGPWLATPERFDVIAVWKLDRLSRKVVHFSQLMDWCDERGKTIVSVTEGVDMSTPMGRVFAHMIAAFAQGEREVIQERVKGSHAKLRADGRYAGAPLPFAYRSAPRQKGGKTLVQDAVYAPVLRRIIRDVTDGASTYEIARQLNAEGLPTWGDHLKNLRADAALESGLEVKQGDRIIRPQRWSPGGVQQIVRSPICCGWKVQTEKDAAGKYKNTPVPVFEPDGVTHVTCTDYPIVTEQEWRAAVAALAARATPGERTARSDAMLVGVAVCSACGSNVYQQKVTRKRPDGSALEWFYYRCTAVNHGRKCPNRASIAADLAEDQVTAQLLALLGDTEIMREEYDPGQDWSGEIAELRQRLDVLEGDFVDGKYDGDEGQDRYHALHARMRARIDALRALPQRPAETRRVPTGETYAQRWESCDRLQRRAFLKANGFRVFVAAAGQSCHKDGVCDLFVCGDDHLGGFQPPLSFQCGHGDGETLPKPHVRLEVPLGAWHVDEDDQGEVWTFDAAETVPLD